MKKCQQNCPICPYIKEGRNLSINNQKWKINNNLNCESHNIVYIIQCNKENCKQSYIGETKRKLKYRIADHKKYVRNENTEQATGQHFNLPGHSLANLTVSILEKVKKQENLYRKEREKYYINKFNTFYKGLNKQM